MIKGKKYLAYMEKKYHDLTNSSINKFEQYAKENNFLEKMKLNYEFLHIVKERDETLKKLFNYYRSGKWN